MHPTGFASLRSARLRVMRKPLDRNLEEGMKKELHVKWMGRTNPGYAVCYKDRDGWRSCSGSMTLTRDEALLTAKKIATAEPERFLQTICDCGTAV